MGEGSPYPKGTNPLFERYFCFMQNTCKIFMLEFIKTSKAEFCVHMHRKNTNFKVLSNSLIQTAVLWLLLF
jgi:hypothetical protein